MAAPDWNAPIDAYCERVGVGLLAEPLNLVSNLAFVAAGVLIWRAARRDLGTVPRTLGALCGLAVLVGLGSATFHSVATQWAQVADIVPIVVFLLSVLGVALRQLYGAPASLVGLGLAGFLGLSALLTAIVPAAPTNGSQPYFGTLVTLVLLGLGLRTRKPAVARPLLLAAPLFTLSLLARIADPRVCEAFPLGTHFVWHLFNGGCFYLVLRALLVDASSPR
mgnify:CR=1 FL=1